MERCSFCLKQIAEEDEANVCMNCGGLFHDWCAPVCCEEATASYVDAWLEGLAIDEIDRLERL
jgi:hypothetical protein